MSRFFSSKFRDLKAYVPGEQPREMKYIKLNTNENPYPPHPDVAAHVAGEAVRLNLYNDTECSELREVMAQRLGILPENLLFTNGSDEILYFAFMAFCDMNTPAVFADITYGFYSVFSQINQLPFRTVPLREDMSIRPEDYYHCGGTVFIANPNAPTGIALPKKEIIRILEENPDHVVVVDEAYIDFGGESCISLIERYRNLLVTQTFSKSRSMAGLRLGFGAACPELIRDLKTIQFSTNPYNVDRLAQAAGIACIQQDEYNTAHTREIIETRESTAASMKKMGFSMTESSTNFLFVRHPAIEGEKLYLELKKRGILIRHFSQSRIREYNRITIGTPGQMQTLLKVTAEILEEQIK